MAVIVTSRGACRMAITARLSLTRADWYHWFQSGTYRARAAGRGSPCGQGEASMRKILLVAAVARVGLLTPPGGGTAPTTTQSNPALCPGDVESGNRNSSV